MSKMSEVVAEGDLRVEGVDRRVGARRDGGIGDAVLVQQDGQRHRGLVAIGRLGDIVSRLQHAVPTVQ